MSTGRNARKSLTFDAATSGLPGGESSHFRSTETSRSAWKIGNRALHEANLLVLKKVASKYSKAKNNNIFSILPNIKVTKLSYIFVYKNIESKILWDFRNEIYKKFNKVISCRGEKLFEWKTTSSSLASASLTPLFLSVFLSIFRPFARLLLGALKFDFYCTIK